jgi:hypothetical protein
MRAKLACDPGKLDDYARYQFPQHLGITSVQRKIPARCA